MYRLVLSKKASKDFQKLPKPVQKRYQKAFQLLAQHGPAYPSLRTHRYQCTKGEQIWGSSASMALRFYWQYTLQGDILVASLDSH